MVDTYFKAIPKFVTTTKSLFYSLVCVIAGAIVSVSVLKGVFTRVNFCLAIDSSEYVFN